MTDATDWRRQGVKVSRAAALAAAMAGTGRATACHFAGSDGAQTWIGAVSVPPGSQNGAHHHGRTEVTVYVVKGRGRFRWGNRLEFAADLGPGDFAYFPPFVPHQEANLDPAGTLDLVAVRSNGEGIFVEIDADPVEQPEMAE